MERIAYLLLALHTLATFAREAGMAEVTYQSVMGLLDAYRSRLSLLASIDRLLFLKRLAKRLAGQIVPMTGGAPAAMKRLRQPRAAAEQWALGYFSTEFLMMVAEQRSR